MKPFPRAEISRSALQSNLVQLRLIAPNSKVMAVVKANGYGHGFPHWSPARIEGDESADGRNGGQKYRAETVLGRHNDRASQIPTILG